MIAELKPIRIGEVEIAFPVFLAPLAGYSDLAYRLICRHRGAPYCATEMALDQCILRGPKVSNRLVQLTDEDHPLAGQLIGNDPATMARAAEILCAQGVDVVDLNFACPVRKALARRRGGHMMREPDLAVEITRAVLAASDRPVTLKLRRGFDDDGDDAFYRIAEAAYSAGAAAVCLHARTVAQRYAGPADWEFLARAKAHFPDRLLFGSGDVHSPAAALEMLASTGVDGVAVARGGLGNPWFFRQTLDLAAGRAPYQPSLAEQRHTLMDHFTRACEIYGPRRGPKIMRKFGIKYARLHPNPKKVRLAFIAVQRPGEWMAVLGELYPDNGPTRPGPVSRAPADCSETLP